MRIVCHISGCNTRARSVKSALCEKHYYRLRRNGSLELHEWPAIRIEASGYVQVFPPEGHPLTPAAGRVREHRLVMFDHRGFGPYVCRWCEAPLTWESMDIDHVDANKQNNAIENLVPACPQCNRDRGTPKMIATQRAKAEQIQFNGKSMCLAEWAVTIGISPGALAWRFQNGWSLSRALTEGRGKTGPKSQRYG